MTKIEPSNESSQEAIGSWIIIAIVVIAFAVSIFSIYGYDYIDPNPLELILGVVFGLLFLILILRDNIVYDHLPHPWNHVLYFTLQLLLIFGFGMMLGTYGNWLISLPLVGTGVEKLKSRWRWLLYIGTLITVAAPMAVKYENLQASFTMAITFSPGIFFVALFTQLRLDERQARRKAERLAAELEQANQQLTQYAVQAEELATIKERNRLAREIHDNLGHSLTIVNVQIEAARTVMEKDAERALEALDKAQRSTQEGLQRVRESVSALRESPLGNQPLSEAIKTLVNETEMAGIVTHFEVNGKASSCPDQVKLTLYRVAQEALTNIRKHARASRVDVRLDFENPSEIILLIKDNGVGASTTRGGFGLVGISERVQMLNGRLNIKTSPGQGFELEVCIPCDTQTRDQK